MTNIGEYRDLDSKNRVFLIGKGMEFKFFRRSGGVDINLKPAGTNNYFKKPIKNSGITGFTYKNFRSSLASRM